MRKMFKKKRKKTEMLELDITSLLDILVILLVFLLKSYNASDLKLDLVKGLTVPSSHARKLGNSALIIQVDKNNGVWLKNKKIGVLNTRTKEINFLYSALKEQKEIIKSKNGKESNAINFVFHKEQPYKNLQKIMHTSALVGYTEFKFIVQGNF